MTNAQDDRIADLEKMLDGYSVQVKSLKEEIDRLKYTITILKECSDAKDGRIAELEMAMDLWSSDNDERETDERGNPKGSIKQFVLQELETYGKMILDVVNKVREG